MDDDLTPSGSEVVKPGVNGLGSFFNALGSLAVTGISRRIDLELPAQPLTPDTATTAKATDVPVSPPGLGSVFESLTPIQLGGLVLAGALSFALATGKFR